MLPLFRISPGLDKLSYRSIKCMFVRYSRTQQGYRCFHPPTIRYFVSVDVTFFESQTYFDGTTSYVEYAPLSSAVEPSATKEIESTTINNEMLCFLQVYRRR